MNISPVFVVVAVGVVVVGCLLLRYVKVAIHVLILTGKVAGIAVVAFALVYATGIWRPDLSPLMWLISKVGAVAACNRCSTEHSQSPVDLMVGYSRDHLGIVVSIPGGRGHRGSDLLLRSYPI